MSADRVGDAGVAADPPTTWASEDGALRLRFVTAQIAGPAHRERRGVEFPSGS